MQSNAQKLWIPSPSGSTITTDPNFPGEIRIVDQMSILASSVSRCDKVCASPCQQNEWTIEFQNVDFGLCNECGKSVGFTLLLDRNPDFDNQTYFEYNQRKQYVYQGILSGNVTGTALAQWFFTYITDLQNQNDQHDQFLIDVSIDPANLDTLIIKLPCSGLVTYNLLGIYQLPNNNLPANELPVFFEVQDGVEAVLSREKLLQQFPQEVGHVFGEAPRDQFMWCQTICVIKLKGCIDACSDFYDNQNSGHLHTGATPFDLLMYVNSAAPGFNDFIDSLINEINSCSQLDNAPGYQSGFIGPVTPGVDLTDLIPLIDAVNGTDVVVTIGSLSFTLNITSLTDLESQINGLFGAGTAILAGNILELGPPVNAFGDYVVVSLPQQYVNYVGE
jgi:hypothetical protein